MLRPGLAGTAGLVLLAVPVLAGCLGALDGGVTLDPADLAGLLDDAELRCVDGAETATVAASGTRVCNLEATLYPEGREGNELSIAVNPRDPDNLIATAKDYTPREAGDCVWDGVYTSLDGGRTWKNQNIPGSPWRLLEDPLNAEPHPEFSTFWCATDPVVRFGPDGTAYWTVMPYQCDPVTGSKTGDGVHPDGGFNDWLWSCSSMYVLRSEDGGMTWPHVRRVAEGPRLQHDKQWIAASPDGQSVLLCWDQSPITGPPTGVPAWPLPPVPEFGAVCAVSTDRSETWSDLEYVAPDDPVYIPAVDYQPDGTAVMAAMRGAFFGEGTIVFSESGDGLDWDAPTTLGNFTAAPTGGSFGWPALRNSVFRVLNIPSIAADRSAGPYGGGVYVTWFDHAHDEGRILFAHSHDGGQTWAEPFEPAPTVADNGHDRFMPAVSVGPDGTVDLSWYDRRDDVDNRRFHLYYAYSLDGGKTWSEPLRVTDVPSDERYSHHQNGMVFMGDYRDGASSEGAAHLVWTDTRHEQADVFVATVERPGANRVG